MLGLTGDDTLIRRQHGIIYALATLLIILLVFVSFAFGYIQLMPRSHADQTCSYVLHPMAQNHFIRLNWTIFPRRCHG